MRKVCRCFLLLVCILSAGLFFPAETHSKSISLSMHQTKGIYTLEGVFEIPVSRKIAWGVLTDYDHIDNFVSSMSKSEVRERKRNLLLLEQEGKAKFLFFSKTLHLLLEIIEYPRQKITFKDSAFHDFHIYEGNWSLQEKGGEMLVSYYLRSQPKAAFFVRPALTTIVRELLEEVRDEMLRRTDSSSPKNNLH